MPFKEIDVNKEIIENCEKDPIFKEKWESSRQEYRIIGEIIKLRNQQGITQNDLACSAGVKQQVISRFEKKENSPTLKTLCNILDGLGQEIKLVPKSH
jgi:DNA-binding XRE family transcriptional regulator